MDPARGYYIFTVLYAVVGLKLVNRNRMEWASINTVESFRSKVRKIG